MKTKSDEASNSLLRYFRFPSPPRHSADNSDSASIDLSKHTHVRELQNGILLFPAFKHLCMQFHSPLHWVSKILC